MDSGQGNWAGVVKTTFGVCEDFSLKKGWFFIPFCTLSKIIVDFCQIFMAGFPKHQSTCPEKNFERKKVTKRWFFCNFVLWVKNIGLWAKQFDKGCQSCIWRVQRNLLSIFRWKKQWFLNDFRTLSKKVPYFAKTLRQGFRKFNLRVRRIILRKKNWKKRWFLSNFVLWVENIGLWAKQFGRGYQSFIRRVQRILLSIFHWKNDDFWMKFVLWAKKFRTFPKLYGRVSETSSYVSREKFWDWKTLKKWWFLSIFVLWNLKNWTLGKTIWQGLSKLYSARPEENCEGFSLKKKRCFFISLCTFSKIIVDFCQTFTAGFPKLQSMCPEKNCERDKIWKNDEFLVILYSKFKKLDFGQNSLARVVKAAIGVSRGIFWAFFIGKTMIFEWYF